MITDEDKLVAREIRQDCYQEFSDPYQGASDFDVTATQELISAYRQRIEARCSLQFGEFIRRREDDFAALREENARLREIIALAEMPLRLYAASHPKWKPTNYPEQDPAGAHALLAKIEALADKGE